MYTKDISDRSPLRVLEQSTRGGLGRGNLGVVMARAGVGKTACLVQIALDDLLRERRVFHVALEQPVHRVRSWYDELFHEVAEAYALARPDAVRVDVERNRHIHSYVGHSFTTEKLREAISFLKEFMHFEPDVVVIDDFPWAQASRDDVAGLRALATEMNAELWFTALCHRDEPIEDPRGIPNPVARFAELVSVIVYLDPERDDVRLRLLKDHDNPTPSPLSIALDPRSMLLARDRSANV